MLHSVKGILLRATSYAESSLIAVVFTDKFGLQHYLVQGAKRPKAKIKANLFQPLHLLDLVVYHREGRSLQRIAEARQQPALTSIPYEIRKSSIALFLNEILYKSVKQQGEDLSLFQFIYHHVVWLDSVSHVPADFHIYFLLHLTKYLGFFPERPEKVSSYFDLKEGRFTQLHPPHSNFLGGQQTKQFYDLLILRLDDLGKLFKTKITDRRILLSALIDYYRLHIDHFGDVQAHLVLEEVLSDS